MTTNARTDPETGLRFYDWEGLEYPSVTSVRRLIGMPFNLHHWVLSQVIDRAISDHDLITQMLARPRRPRERVRDENVIREVAKHLRAAATAERDLAGDRGTRAHDAIALGLSPEEVDPDIYGHVSQYYDALRTLQPRVLWSERQVWNLTYGYAGTADTLWQLPSGHIVCVDYKTSKGVYLDHAIQIIAYGMGEFVGENDVIDQQATAALKAASGLAILHLSEQDWEWIEIEPNPVIFQGFLGSLTFAKFLYAMKNELDPLIIRRQRGGTLVPVLAKSVKMVQQKEQFNGADN